jgi:putative effector of murein hydrolase
MMPFPVHVAGLGIALTLGAWLLAKAITRRAGMHPLANPSLIASLLVIAALVGLDIPYATYLSDAHAIQLLLAPAVVALAVPCWRQLAALRAFLPASIGAALAGVLTCLGVTLALSVAFGLPESLTASLLPHSATAGIALASAERMGGDAGLAACLAVITGCFGAVVAQGALALLRLRAPDAVGAAAGTVAHGIATARMLAWHPAAGAFAALAMVLAGILTALLAPLAMALAS